MVPVFLTVLLEPEFLRAHYHSCSTARPRAHLPYRREAAVPWETACLTLWKPSLGVRCTHWLPDEH